MKQDKDLKKWIKYFVWSLVVLAAVLAFYAINSKDEAQKATGLTTEVIEAIVKSCEDNGNPLREVLQEEIEENKEQSENKELLEEYFPNADPEKLDRLLVEQIEKYEERLDKIEPLDCQSKYPDKK